jgi:hypothetical protein
VNFLSIHWKIDNDLGQTLTGSAQRLNVRSLVDAILKGQDFESGIDLCPEHRNEAVVPRMDATTLIWRWIIAVQGDHVITFLF